MTIIEICIGIIVPIVSSILGGLFTFLGVRLTIKSERKTQEENVELKIIESNEKIVKERPKLKSTEAVTESGMKADIYLIPYGIPILINERDILFQYPQDLNDNEKWESYSVYLKNVGHNNITRSFLHIEDDINMYSDIDMYNWNDPMWGNHYFSDGVTLSGSLQVEEILELNIYFLKEVERLKQTKINIYFEDENGNKWVQYAINKENNNDSVYSIVSDFEYSTLRRKDMTRFFLYNKLFFDDKVEKTFDYDSKEIMKKLKKELDLYCDITNKFERFRYDCKCGKAALKKDFSDL